MSGSIPRKGDQRPTRYTAVATAMKLKNPCQLNTKLPHSTRFGPMSISIMTALIYVRVVRVSRKALVAPGGLAPWPIRDAYDLTVMLK